MAQALSTMAAADEVLALVIMRRILFCPPGIASTVRLMAI